MYSFSRSRRPAAGPKIARTSALLILLLLPGVLSAQTVQVNAGGNVSVGGVPALYNGQYVMQKTDFGFLWLDTVALQGGHVQVEAKCGVGQPPSVSGLYVVGDCNGISDIKSTGNVVLARQLSGQCGAARLGCGGPRDDGHAYFLFGLGGGFPYQGYGTGNEAGDSTQTADPQGRTWSVTTLDGTTGHFEWRASGNPNAPPVANVSATNTSAAGRNDKANYFGDSWTLRDTSTSIATITGVQWDYNYVAPNFTADRQGTAGETVSLYFPCDPNAGGNIATGAGCFASVGGAAGSYAFSLKATNNPQGTPQTTQYTPAGITVAVPQIQILGFSAGVLAILTGGNADAHETQGSPTAFNWTFNPGAIARTGAVVAAPAGATSFTLQVTYAGYTANASGTVTQTDLVADFGLSPNPVLVNSTLTLTNEMQKSAAATLNSVEYSLDSGAFTSLVTCPGPSFCSAGGTVTLTSPAAPAGNHTLALRYNYTGSSGAAQATASNPFATTTFTPNPIPIVTVDPGGLQLACTGFGTCNLQVSTNYYLFDAESRPTGINPDTTWGYQTAGNIGTAVASAGPVQWTTPGATCSSNCNLLVTVAGATRTLAINISSGGGGGPTPPSVTISGPNSLNVSQSGTFTANVSNAQGNVSYAWIFDDNPFPQTGGISVTHSWSSNGSHSATVSISATNGSAQYTLPVSVVGKPAPLGTFTATPSQASGTTYTVGRGVEITFTSDETSASQWGWDFGDGTLAGGASARSAKKTYATLGNYSGSLLVYGDGNVKATGPTITPFTVVVTIPAPSTAFTVQNATQNLLTGNYDAYAGATLTFTATETRAVNWGWDFGDGSPVAGKTVTHVFPSIGSYTAHLLVYGDGVNTAQGPSVANITFNVTKSPFQAVIVPGAAHLDDGTNTWGTDLSISNAGTGAMTVNLAFLPFLSDAFAPSTQDLSSLTFGAPLALPSGGSWSATDVVDYLNGGNNKGTVVIKYSGGSAAPLVSARVYFQPKTNPRNISYGSGIPAYNIDGAGQISAQGIGSGLTSGQPTGLNEKASEALEDTITVSKTGTGSGKVTSNPAGIDCGATCTFSFPSGSTVYVLATADPGSTLFGLTGCTGYVTGQCYVTGSATVTAQFDASAPPGNSTLTVSKTGTGSGTVSSSPAGIDCGSTCSASFAPTTSVTLTATAGSGSAFAGWGGACAGTGASCVISMATSQSVNATFTGSGPPPPTPSPDQVLIGLTATPRYRFGVTLFNASGASGNFRIAAMDEESSGLLIDDGTNTKNFVPYRDFAIRPYQQVYLTNDDLGLTDSNRHYVLKGTRNSSSGTLLAFGTSLDRTTRDLVQITDDGQASPAEAGLVNYWVAGVSRYDSTYGAHWRTDLRIYNRGSHARILSFDYSFSGDGVTERVAHVINKINIRAGELLSYDDVVTSLLAQDTGVDLSGSSAGVLRIYYQEDSESSTRPLIIGSRNYDDQPTGTAGSQLAVYTRSQGGSSTRKLSVAGAEESLRYSSRIGVFTMDPGPVAFRIVAIDSNGVEVGSLVTGLGGAGLHFGQLDLTNAAFNFTNPGKPVTIRIDSISGGRVGAYVFTVDKVTLDTNFLQALP